MYLSNEQATEFFDAVCRGISAPVSRVNQSFFLAWRRGEQNAVDPSTEWNPLDTERSTEADGSTPIAGATDFNTAGVKNYPDEATGVRATVNTLLLPYYRNTVEALRNSFENSPQWFVIAGEIDTWGTHAFAAQLKAGWRPDAADPELPAIPAPAPVPADPPSVIIDAGFEARLAALQLQCDRQNTAILARVGAIRDAFVEYYGNYADKFTVALIATLNAAADPAHIPGEGV